MGTLSLMCRYDCYKCCCSKERLGPLIGFCVIGIFSLYTGGIFLFMIFCIISDILNKNESDNCFVPCLYFSKDDERYYQDCNGRYNCCYTMHFLYYFAGIVIVIISDYFEKYRKEFVIGQMVILNLFTGGFGSIIFAEVFVDKNNNHSCDKVILITFISIMSILIHYNAVYFTFFYEIEDNLGIYIFLPVCIIINIYLIHQYNRYGNYDN